MPGANPLSERVPLLIVISGPSGVGKDSVVRRMEERGLSFHFVVTTTSRPRRPEEVHGRDYIFVSVEAFEAMIEAGQLLEHALVYNQHKGISRQQVSQALASGEDVVMRLDVQGAQTVRRLCPEAVLIYLTTRDEDELRRRLKQRRTESDEAIELRLATARQELTALPSFDYLVVNADGALDQAAATIAAIIEAEHHRVVPRRVSL